MSSIFGRGGFCGSSKDDNDGSLRGRGCKYLDKSEGLKHGFALKYLNKRFVYAAGAPKVPIKMNQIDPVIQT